MEEFIPKRLMEARQIIAQELPLKSKHKSTEPIFSDIEKREFLTDIAKLSHRLVSQRAYALSYEQVEVIADYLAGNVYHLKLDNFCSILKIREDKHLYDRLIMGWESYYDNEECNKFLFNQVKTSEALQASIADLHLRPDDFAEMIHVLNIPEWWGGYLEKHPAPKVDPWNISGSMDYYKIIRDSRLYNQIQLRYYLVCDRRAFVCEELTPSRLRNYIDQYSHNKDDIRRFTIHFLECFDASGNVYSKPWQSRFYPIAPTFERIVGANGTRTQDVFFENIAPRLKNRFQQWLNRAKIENTFGSTDERTRFWQRFEFGDVKFHNTARVLVMQTRDKEHYVIEFQGKAQGPVYILDKETYLGMQWHIRVDSNPELRAYLFAQYNDSEEEDNNIIQSPRIHRQEHRGDWKLQMEYYMINNHLAEHSTIPY